MKKLDGKQVFGIATGAVSIVGGLVSLAFTVHQWRCYNKDRKAIESNYTKADSNEQ